MSNKEIYQKLIAYLDNPTDMMGLTESEWMIPTVTSYITPEEAELLTGLPFKETSLEELAELKKMDPVELQQRLKQLCVKGLVHEEGSGDTAHYKLLQAWAMFLRYPFWAGKDDESLKALAAHANKYFYDGWHNELDVDPEIMRAIPINETVEADKKVVPYSDIQRLVDGKEYYTVSHCPCRERHRLDPDYQDSHYPSEVCLHFNELGRHIVNSELGREITKEETLEILKKSADAGLVHNVGNYQENLDTICNCDGSYCLWFNKYHVGGQKKAAENSGYLVKVTPETCKACGLCTKRCPMDAIQMKISAKATNKFGKAVEVDSDKCVGCGVCVHKCPTDSIIMERREDTTPPVKTAKEWYMGIIASRTTAKVKQA